MVLRNEYYESLKLKDKKAVEITNTDMFEAVWKYVSGIPRLHDAVDLLYYANPAVHPDSVTCWAEGCEVRAVVQSGGNEGVLIDYYLEGRTSDEPKILQLGTLKALGEDIDTCINMGMLAGALMRVGELFLVYNLF